MNVVLLLMVFLLLTGELGRASGSGIPEGAALPRSSESRPGIATPLRLTLDRQGRLQAADGRGLLPSQLPGWWSAQPAAQRSAGLIVAADAQTPAPQVVALLSALRAAGVPGVRLEAQRR